MKLLISLFALFSILFISSCSTVQPSIERAFVFKDGVLLYHNQEVNSIESSSFTKLAPFNIKKFITSNFSLYICDKRDNVSWEIPYSSIRDIKYNNKELYILQID